MIRKIIFLVSFSVCAIWMTGCGLRPKPLQFSGASIPSQRVSARKDSIEVVFPDKFRTLKLSQKSFFTGILNTLEVEIGKDVHQVINNQLSNYYKNVIFSNKKSTRGSAVISITHLSGRIGKVGLSVDVNIELELMLPGKPKPIQRSIHIKGQGHSLSTLLGGAFLASTVLTKAEHEAMQEVIRQLTPIIQLAYEAGDPPDTSTRLAKTKKRSTTGNGRPPAPPKVKNVAKKRGVTRDNIPPKIIVTSHDITGQPLQLRKKKVQIMGKANDSSGIAEVLVNNKEAIIDSKGRFMVDIFLQMGKNNIEIRAMDTHENVGIKSFTLIRKSSGAGSPAIKSQERRIVSGRYHALVIGNNNYRHLSNLETAKKDARAVAKILEREYGFQVKLLLDATRNNILRALNDFRRRLTERDNFLLYYAGHGKLDKVSGRAYWLPVDARPDDDTSWIIADRITSNVKRIAANHILIVADSCYSGTLTRSTLSDLRRGRERKQYLRKMRKKTSRTLLASGGNEPVADGGGNGHSVFAEAFLQGLKEIDHEVFSVEELFYRGIKERVAGNADQTPEYHVIRNSGHDGGDFVFEKVARH